MHDLLVLTLDRRGRIERVEGFADELLTTSRARAVGCVLEDVVPVGSALRMAARSGLGGLTYRGEQRDSTGALFEVRGSPRAFDHADGSGGAILVATRTERARPRHHDRDFDRIVSAMDLVPGAIWTTDLELRITLAIGRLRNGRKLSEFTGWTIQDFVGKRDPADVLFVNYRAVLDGESRSFPYTFGGRWYEVVIEPLRNGREAIIGSTGIALDVTDRRAAEKRLAESDARLETMQAVAHVGTWEWTLRKDQIAWSDELYRIYGLEQQTFEHTFASFVSHVYPDDVAASRAAVETALRTKSPFRVDHRIVRPDGVVRMLHTVGDVRVGIDGEVEALLGCCWDVTERWEATRRAEESASLLRETLESTADGILVIDRDGRVRAFNARFVEMWRVSAEILATGDDRTILATVLSQLDDPAGFRERVEALYARPDAESFDRVHLADGRTFERYSKPHRLGEQIVGRVWSFRDVTDRERLLRRTLFLADASRLLASLDALPALDGLARLAVVSMADACIIELFAFDADARKRISRAHGSDAEPACDIPHDVMTGRVVSYSEEGRSRVAVPLQSNGRVSGAIVFVARPGITYAAEDVALFEELARRIDLSVENARLFREVQSALKTREEFLSMAAHEIRGPITSMHLAAQMLQRADLPADAQHQSLAIITREDDRLTRFVDELLDVARFRSGKMAFEFTDVDLVEVVRAVGQRLASDLGRSGSALTVTAPDRLEGVWDRSRLDQVVTNLLSNSIKFGLGRPIELELTGTRERARICVRDHGIGIPVDRQDAVFRAFERAVSVRNYGGLGLGLYIVHEIVSGLGGTVRLESQPGAGTTVTIELPRQRRGG